MGTAYALQHATRDNVDGGKNRVSAPIVNLLNSLFETFSTVVIPFEGEMPWETVIYERERLYEEVWSTPVREVAKTYGISDVALGKICRRLGVPMPGRGYWARKNAGQDIKREPLRPLREGQPSSHRVQRYKDPIDDIEIGDEAKALLAQEDEDVYQVIVPDILPDKPHPLIKRFAGTLRKSQKKRDTLLLDRECLDIKATGDALERALRIAHSILLALDKRGFDVEVTQPKKPINREYYGRREVTPSKTTVHILGSAVE